MWSVCESKEWQQIWARQKLGFQGNIVTDCTALNMAAPSPEHSMDAPHNAAAGLKAGTDLNCGNGWDGKAHGYTAAADAIKQVNGIVVYWHNFALCNCCNNNLDMIGARPEHNNHTTSMQK